VSHDVAVAAAIARRVAGELPLELRVADERTIASHTEISRRSSKTDHSSG
jgi:hypothetical protein